MFVLVRVVHASFQIENTIEITNDGFAQSGVLIRLRLICTELYTGPETNDAIQQLEAFRDHKGSVANVRDTADIAMLLVSR